MAQNFFIAYPDIPKRATDLQASNTYSNQTNLIAGSRATYAELTTAAVGQTDLGFDLGVGVTASADHFGIARARLMRGSGCKSVVLRGSTSRVNAPEGISGLQFWFDAAKKYTLHSTYGISAITERSTNALAGSQGTSVNMFKQSRADNRGNWIPNTRLPASWGNNNIASTNNYARNYDGTFTAGRLIAAAGTAAHYIQQSTSGHSSNLGRIGLAYKTSYWLKYVNHALVWIGDGSDSPWHGARVNIQNGTIDATQNLTTSSITAVGDGWYRIDMTWTRVASGNIDAFVNIAHSSATSGTNSWTAAGTEEVLFGGCTTRLSTWDDDLVINADANVSLAGINGNRSAWCFDTSRSLSFSDDSDLRLTGDFTIAFAYKFYGPVAGTDVIASKRDANNGWICGLAVTSSTVVTPRITTRSGGVSDTGDGTSFDPAGECQVLVCVKSGTNISWYRNGSAAGTDTAANAGSYTGSLIVGDTTDFLNGQLGEILIYNAALGTTDRETVENYLISKWRTAPAYQIHNLNEQTLLGPLKEDWIGTFTATTAYRYWWVHFDSEVSSKRPVSKLYIGTGFDFGHDPLYQRSIRLKQELANPRGPEYTIRLSMQGFTDSVRDSFFEKIGSLSDLPVMFYTTTYDGALNDWGCAHVTLLPTYFENYELDLNKMALEAETLI